MIAIDILYLVDRLEALLSKGMRVPMTNKTMIDEDEFLDIVDQMRVAIPEEIKLAKKLQQDRDRMLAQAQEEAARLVALAKEDAANLVSDHAVTKAAEELAAEIEGKARADSEAIRRDADEYTAQILSQLQGRLEQMAQQIATMQNQVYNGLTFISEKSQVAEVAEVGELAEAPANPDETLS
jgi:cell division septum initiation protein DivIVA